MSGVHVEAGLPLLPAAPPAAVVTEVAGAPDLRFAAAPELSTLVFRYVPPGRDLDDVEVGALNTRIREELYASGAAMVAATRVDGVQHLKLTLLNPMATVDDIVGVLDAVREVGARLAGEVHGDRVAAAMEAVR